MGNENMGAGAEVGVRKMNDEGEVTETSGNINNGRSRISWMIFYMLIILSLFGVWQIIELILKII